MIDENREDIHVERLDDIPLLLAFLYQMGIATLLDKQYPTHGNWAGEFGFWDCGLCVALLHFE